MNGVAVGINYMLEIFNEKYYDNLEGGILEAFGRLFRNDVKLYIYPMTEEAYARYMLEKSMTAPPVHSSASHILINAKNVRIPDHLANLYAHLIGNHYIESIVGFDVMFFSIVSREVLKLIKKGELIWEKMVPGPVAEAIKRRGLFGHVTAMPTGQHLPQVSTP